MKLCTKKALMLRAMHLPYLIAAIGMSRSAGKHVPISASPYILRIQPFKIPFIEKVRDIFIPRLRINDWSCRPGFQRFLGEFVFFKTALVAGLKHVYIKPIILPNIVACYTSAVGVVSHQVDGIMFPYSGRHCPDDLIMALFFGHPVSSQHPNYITVPGISSPQEFSVGSGIFGGKNLRTLPPGFVPFVAPGG